MRVIRMHACMPRTCTPRTHAEGAWRNDRTYLRVRPGGDEDGECPVLIECDGSGAEPSKVSAAHNGKSEAFAFDRTASRLQDMMSEEYMTKMHAPPSQSLGADSEGGAPLEVLSELHHALSEKEVGPLWPPRLHVQRDTPVAVHYV